MRRTIVPPSLIVGALLGAGCNDVRATRPPPTIEVAPPPPEVSSAAPPPAPDADLMDRLAREVVFHRNLSHRTFFTWTTGEQVAELSRTKVLLSRTESPTRGKAFFDRRRLARPWSFARIFDEPALAKRRFAWPTAWATVLGGDAESYGDRLVRVVLKPESIIAHFDPDSPENWRFHDIVGHDIGERDAIREAHRIAAVFHVYQGEENGEAAPYREVVLCNEHMIEEWSVGTEETRFEITRSIDLLRRLRAEIERVPPDHPARPWARKVAREAWPGPPPKRARMRALWEASLAFANDRYQLDAASLDAIVKALEAALPALGEALRVRPTTAFPGFEVNVNAPPVPGALPTTKVPGHSKPVKCVPMGTFGCWPLGNKP